MSGHSDDEQPGQGAPRHEDGVSGFSGYGVTSFIGIVCHFIRALRSDLLLLCARKK